MLDGSGKPIKGLFGAGIGYSLSTQDKLINSEKRKGARADFVEVYHLVVPIRILKCLLPDEPMNILKFKKPEAKL